MPEIAWRSPFPQQRLGGKGFGLAFTLGAGHSITVEGVLDWVAGATMEIDGGTLWQSSHTLVTPPGSPPEVKQVVFNARYNDGNISGTVRLTAICGPSIQGDGVGLELIYVNQADTFGPPWRELPERIVAVTTMHAGDYFQRALGFPWPNPIENWTWTAGGWAMAAQMVEYQGWLVSLV